MFVSGSSFAFFAKTLMTADFKSSPNPAELILSILENTD